MLISGFGECLFLFLLDSCGWYPFSFFFTRVFGKRYREVIRGWEASLRAGGVNDRRWVFITSILLLSYEFDLHFFLCVNVDRINWSGSALSTFYAAIRKALVVVIVARALGILFGLGFATWWIFS